MTTANTATKRIITGLVGALNLAGSAVCASLLIGVLCLSWLSGVVGGIPAILIALTVGTTVGIKLAFTWINFAVTYHPDLILRTYEEWKRTGKWDELVAALHAKRLAAADSTGK